MDNKQIFNEIWGEYPMLGHECWMAIHILCTSHISICFRAEPTIRCWSNNVELCLFSSLYDCSPS